MNDSNQSSIQLFWSIQETIPHIEIHSTLYKKWMILSIVLFNYSDEFDELSHTLRFIAHYIRNEWFSPEFCLTILMNSRTIVHIEIHSTLHKKWMILSRALFNYSDQFKKLSHTLKFIAHYIRNEWSWTQLSSTILNNSRNYPTCWDS